MGLCELDEGRAADFRRRHPGIRVESDLDAALADPRSRRSRSRPRPTPTSTSSAARSKPASTCWSRSRWPAPPTRRPSWSRSPRSVDLVLMPGHTFLYSPSVNKVRDLIQPGRARRDLLRHLLAHEPRPLPAGRRRPRPRPARPLDPPPLARQAAASRSRRTAAASSRRASTRPPSSPCASRAAPRPTSRSPGWRRARCARWSSSAVARMVQYEDTAADDSVRDLRPRPRLLRAARQLRRVPAHLPHRRHGGPADRGRRSRSAWSCRTSPTAIRDGQHAGLQRPARTRDRARPGSAGGARCTPAAPPSRCARSTRCWPAPVSASEPGSDAQPRSHEGDASISRSSSAR